MSRNQSLNDVDPPIKFTRTSPLKEAQKKAKKAKQAEKVKRKAKRAREVVNEEAKEGDRARVKRSRDDGKSKPQPSKTKMEAFIRRLHGDRPFFYQSYSKEKPPPLPPVWERVRVSSRLIERLIEINRKGMHIGVVPNVMDGKGRSTANCVEIRWLVADFDKGEHSRESLLKMAVKPTFIVETSPGRFHAYWRIEGCSVKEYTSVQRALAAKLGADAVVIDPSRCMRLPGTLNHRCDPPFTARVVFPSHGDRRGSRTTLKSFLADMGLQVSAPSTPVTAGERTDDESLTDAQISNLLTQIEPDEYGVWREVGQALHSRYPTKEGRHIWDEWSSGCKSKFNLNEQRREWATFESDGGITIGRLVYLARASGAAGVSVPTTESQLAAVIADRGRDSLRFSLDGQSCWLYVEGVWVKGKVGHAALVYARRLMEELLVRAGEPIDSDALRISLLRGAVGLAQLDARLHIDEALFDADPYLFGVKNGVIDLRSSAFRAATPADLLTKQASVIFDPGARCPHFEKALDEICRGRVDLRKYIVRLMGYTILGLASEEKLFILRGKSRNGKGTLMNLMRKLLGSYAVSAAPTLFTKAYKGGPHDATAALIPLRGARMIICTELKKDKLDEEFVKQLSGGDALMGRGLFEGQMEFTPVGKVWLSTNDEPDISAGADAMWDRIVVLPFDASFKGKKMDTRLKEVLAGEGPGVLNLMVKAAQKYLAAREEVKGRDGKQPTGLRESKTVADATSAMRVRADTVQTWVRACCKVEDGAFMQSSEAHRSYRSFTAKNGRTALGPAAFKEALNDKGHPSSPRKRGFNGFHGLRLREPVRK